MNQLNPFDLLNIIGPKKSIVYCGNAPSLKSESLGQWIDSHDVVIRVNKVPEPSFKSDTGGKTDILVCNPYTCETSPKLPYLEGMLVICLFSLTRRGDRTRFNEWLNGNRVLYSYIPDIVAIDDNRHFESLTTGTYAINLLNRILKPKAVSITGFTMFLGDTDHHYWTNLTPKGVKSHSFIEEAKIFVSLINRLPESTKVTLTSDIYWVSRKVKMKVKKSNITKKAMINTRWDNENRRFWNF
ncbi:glycosyltransferase family 29 protein [Vibrio splendidus]|uniref:glycosyltransferase family 29 protein n=1 Tax=Vibrio splendidus TaxID=29497 RepID=UPI000C8647D0|nr:glycosyltransferase family 29 protein [Vibrio splendidus]PMJ78661.1 hypothetical protein BCU23_13095 [Vibrio splendidus]